MDEGGEDAVAASQPAKRDGIENKSPPLKHAHYLLLLLPLLGMMMIIIIITSFCAGCVYQKREQTARDMRADIFIII